MGTTTTILAYRWGTTLPPRHRPRYCKGSHHRSRRRLPFPSFDTRGTVTVNSPFKKLNGSNARHTDCAPSGSSNNNSNSSRNWKHLRRKVRRCQTGRWLHPYNRNIRRRTVAVRRTRLHRRWCGTDWEILTNSMTRSGRLNTHNKGTKQRVLPHRRGTTTVDAPIPLPSLTLTTRQKRTREPTLAPGQALALALTTVRVGGSTNCTARTTLGATM